MLKAAITDYSYPDVDIESRVLCPPEVHLDHRQCKTAEALIDLVKDADVVITQFAPITKEVIESMSKARAIIRYGIGVDNVHLETAASMGIPVCNVPDYCIDEVADHALSFILASARSIVPNCLHVRAGKWGLAGSLSEMRCMRDQTVGIVGFGRIGREVALRLAGFKCRRLVFDPMVASSVVSELGCESVSLDELFQQSDIVTLHCPSIASTRRVVNEQSLSKMKHGSIVVNVSRGDLVDTKALEAALQSGQLGAAAIDVCDPEPIPPDSPLRSLPNVVSASHLAWASVPAMSRLRETAAKLALEALRGSSPRNVVNGVLKLRMGYQNENA